MGSYFIVPYDRIIYHRDRLEKLGSLKHRKFLLNGIDNSRENRVRIFDSITSEFPDHRLWMLSEHEVPMILDVWEFDDAMFSNWDRLIDTFKKTATE